MKLILTIFSCIFTTVVMSKAMPEGGVPPSEKLLAIDYAYSDGDQERPDRDDVGRYYPGKNQKCVDQCMEEYAEMEISCADAHNVIGDHDCAISCEYFCRYADTGIYGRK